MKRVRSACIFQTLVFAQRPDTGYSRERALRINLEELAHYRASLDAAHTRYQITEQSEQEDGSVVIKVRKQYNDAADVSEYFE